jgi:hypothetical protein
MRRLACFGSILFLLVGGSICRAGEAAKAPAPADEAMAPFAATYRYASEHHIPITGFEAEPNPTKLERSAVALVTLVDGNDRQQWLVRLVIEALPKQPTGTETYTFYTSAGSKFTFGQTHLVRVKTTTWGPFAGGERPSAVKETTDAGTVDLELLGFGLYRAGAIVTGLWAQVETMRRQRIACPPGTFYVTTNPVPPDKIEIGKQFAERFAITSEQQREFSSAFPALISFFNVANSLRGVDAIVGLMVNKASVAWSVLRHGGFTPAVNIDFDATKTVTPPVGLGTDSGYQFQFTISGNGAPLLHCEARVVAPRPYLLTTAGIYRLTAQSVANPARHIVVEVLATSRAGERTAGGARSSSRERENKDVTPSRLTESDRSAALRLKGLGSSGDHESPRT